MQHLQQRDWQGNVRELDNLIHRGVILSHDESTITIDHVDNNMFSGVDHQMGREVLSDLPLMADRRDGAATNQEGAGTYPAGIRRKPQKILGISDRTIRNKLR